MFMDIISNSRYLINLSYKCVSEQYRFKIKSVKFSRLAEIPCRYVQFCVGHHGWLISDWSPMITDLYHVIYDLSSWYSGMDSEVSAKKSKSNYFIDRVQIHLLYEMHFGNLWLKITSTRMIMSSNLFEVKKYE